MKIAPQRWEYPLERLYDEQDPDFVIDAVAQLIAWIAPEPGRATHQFVVRQQAQGGSVEHTLVLSWNLDRLSERDPRLCADLDRIRERKTLTVEDQPKYAAYGLALVAISCILHRRVVGVAWFRPPDLLLDTTPGKLRGVEVAGRGKNGYAAFAQATDGASGKPGKRAQLLERADVVEAYLSLWCRDPMVSIWEKVKP